MQDLGSKFLDHASSIQDPGSRILEPKRITLKDALDAKYDTSAKVSHQIVHVNFVFNLSNMFKLLNQERAEYKMAQRLKVIAADASAPWRMSYLPLAGFEPTISKLWY